MMRKRFFIKGVVVLAACILVPAVLSAASTPGPRRPVEFTLGVVAGDPAPIPFTLTPPSTEPTALAGLGGVDIIEEDGSPYRTALGFGALSINLGDYNTAMGYNAMCWNVAGGCNTALGANALYYNQGGNNTAVGYNALHNSDRSDRNTAIGANAIATNFQATCNTAVGDSALEDIGTNSHHNTALGYRAGALALAGPNGGFAGYNIFIGADQTGMANDANTIRLGLPYTTGVGQNRTFISGIVEKQLTTGDGPTVVGITSEGQLGTMSNDMLPEGPQGPPGIQGPQGPAGEGLVRGSLLYLTAGFQPPSGYVLIGTTDQPLIDPVTKRVIKLKVYVYQKL